MHSYVLILNRRWWLYHHWLFMHFTSNQLRQESRHGHRICHITYSFDVVPCICPFRIYCFLDFVQQICRRFSLTDPYWREANGGPWSGSSWRSGICGGPLIFSYLCTQTDSRFCYDVSMPFYKDGDLDTSGVKAEKLIPYFLSCIRQAGLQNLLMLGFGVGSRLPNLLLVHCST